MLNAFFENMDPTIASAVIGVLGVMMGSLITILATVVMRHFDLKRDDAREYYLAERRRQDKELLMKQEIYKNFLNELSVMEAFEFNSAEELAKQWIKTEVKVDLVATPKVREAKENLQKELLELAEVNVRAKKIKLSESYLLLRDNLLSAIREDLAILKSKDEYK